MAYFGLGSFKIPDLVRQGCLAPAPYIPVHMFIFADPGPLWTSRFKMKLRVGKSRAHWPAVIRINLALKSGENFCLSKLGFFV